MSLLSAERVRLAVGAERIDCVRLQGWRGTPGEPMSCALAMQDGAPDFSEVGDWLGKSGGRLEVVLSNTWVRYVIVPWQDALGNEALAMDFARALFQQQYGDASNGWRVTLSAFYPRRPRVAVAVDERWFAALEGLAARSGMKLAAVRPALAAVLNRVGRELPPNALLAMVEPRRLALLQLAQGQWHSVHNRMLPANWAPHLPGFITQARAALGAFNVPLFIIAPQHERPDLGLLQGTWLRLPPSGRFDPRRDQVLSMCLGV
ncbi:hypothetical protein [Pseudoduganella violaceinigra]|uniref:hypothetical protein n=1 Tax=Pseudoduganella violaceinigra TaxID=246602 RepID=UPI0012B63E94|nr:hypothetical protein [Pseudoduganella violaceinigra]